MTMYTNIDIIDKYKPIQHINDKYVISWGLKKLYENKYQWNYFILNNKPSINTIKSNINAYINEKIKNSIITGFVWNNMNIYLSIENQINYKLLFDSTMLQNGANLPETVKFKINDKNIFYSFETLDEFKDFIIAMNNHIRINLKNGNDYKESINYDDYQL